jgi:hypothetical protein
MLQAQHYGVQLRAASQTIWSFLWSLSSTTVVSWLLLRFQPFTLLLGHGHENRGDVRVACTVIRQGLSTSHFRQWFLSFPHKEHLVYNSGLLK